MQESLYGIIKLKSGTDICHFVKKIKKLKGKTKLQSIKSERYKIDAKSILGILTLDLSSGVKLLYKADESLSEEDIKSDISLLVKIVEKYQ